MDYREVVWWARRAEVHRLSEQLDRIHVSRMVMAKDVGVSRVVSAIEARILSLTVDSRRSISEAWADLKERKRG